jgi:oligopeptidase B
MPEQDYLIAPAENEEQNTEEYRYLYMSKVTPPSTFARNVKTGETRLVKRDPVPTYDPSRYETARVEATASDGTKIPISLAMKKELPRDGSSPMLLNGYGAYGISADAYFNQTVVSYLDRGVVIATAHIRGGGEFGKPWHDAGRMLNKKNTFSDFIAAAEYLVAQHWTQRDRLAINGGSAGGLLMGAVLNARPDLFKAALVEVPFVDVTNTMLDESLPLTVGEFEEWGNPKLPNEYAYINSYSACDNVRAQAYPSILVRSAYNDSQVLYHEPAKYVAKLRALKTDSHPLLLKMEMDPAGHGGRSGRYDELKDRALYQAWVLSQLGLRD